MKVAPAMAFQGRQCELAMLDVRYGRLETPPIISAETPRIAAK